MGLLSLELGPHGRFVGGEKQGMAKGRSYSKNTCLLLVLCFSPLYPTSSSKLAFDCCCWMSGKPAVKLLSYGIHYRDLGGHCGKYLPAQRCAHLSFGCGQLLRVQGSKEVAIVIEDTLETIRDCLTEIVTLFIRISWDYCYDTSLPTIQSH